MLAILGAMDVEITAILGMLSHRSQKEIPGCTIHVGTLLGHQVVVAQSGVGKVRGALCAQSIILACKPRALLFTGIAGGLGSQVQIGDTVVAADLVQHDLDVRALGFARGEVPWAGSRFFGADPRLLARAASFVPEKGCLHVGRICTGDQFMTRSEMQSHSYLMDEFNGLGVEMEGAAVAQAAALHGVPSLVMRTISDKADSSAPADFDAFLPWAGHNTAQFVEFMLHDFPL